MTRRPSRRYQAEQWWPIAARLTGAAIGISQAVGYFLGYRVDPGLMMFAGGLVVAPNIAGTQRRRNQGRDEDDE